MSVEEELKRLKADKRGLLAAIVNPYLNHLTLTEMTKKMEEIDSKIEALKNDK